MVKCQGDTTKAPRTHHAGTMHPTMRTPGGHRGPIALGSW